MNFRNGALVRDRTRVAVERPLTIILNSEEIVTLMCISDVPIYLALGFLYSEGLLDSIDAVKSIEEDIDCVRVIAEIAQRQNNKLKKRVVTTGCGRGISFFYAAGEHSMVPLASLQRISMNTIIDLMKQLSRRSHLHKETRGVHNAALASGTCIELFHTDIGRHNAVDKIYGQSLMEKRIIRDKILLTTGRLTSEIVVKSARMGVPILVSRHAATSMAVNLASQLNITLIGYVRGSRFIVYAGFERVRCEEEGCGHELDSSR